MQPYAYLAAVASKAGVVIKQIGQERRVPGGFQQPTWSWHRPGSAGGSGLPTADDAVMDAVMTLGLMDRGDGYANWVCDSYDEPAVWPKNYYVDICKQCGSPHMRLQRPQ